jgi:hypothetical protein
LIWVERVEAVIVIIRSALIRRRRLRGLISRASNRRILRRDRKSWRRQKKCNQ